MPTYKPFATWDDVLAYVREQGSVYYQAPLDHAPVYVRAELRARGKVRIIPNRWQADAFTADVSHLDRMKQRCLAAFVDDGQGC